MQITQSSDNVQELAGDLIRYFNIDSIVEKEGYSKVECEYDETEALKQVREEFKQYLNRNKKVIIISLHKNRRPARRTQTKPQTQSTTPALAQNQAQTIDVEAGYTPSTTEVP